MGHAVQSLEEALDMVDPGTDLYRALDMISVADCGALICIGDVDAVLEVASGGFELDVPFTPNRLFELAKMDGAIVLDNHARRILRANAHLTPTVAFETKETGMRHRTAMRMCVQTDAAAITVSQRRGTIDVYYGGDSARVDRGQKLDIKTDETLRAMRKARDVLDHEIARLVEAGVGDNSMAE